MNGDVQTDTVWSVTYRDGKQIQITQDNNLFKLSGDIHQSSLDSNFFNYGNYLDIIDCSMKELDGAVISCGSYVNRSQENFSRVFVCGKFIAVMCEVQQCYNNYNNECSVELQQISQV